MFYKMILVNGRNKIILKNSLLVEFHNLNQFKNKKIFNK